MSQQGEAFRIVGVALRIVGGSAGVLTKTEKEGPEEITRKEDSPHFDKGALCMQT